jgi:RNA polymerase sigma-70 factor (ECF subfamily)
LRCIGELGDPTARSRKGNVELETCWTLIRAASAGDARARDDFAQRYGGVLRDFFCARWACGPQSGDVDDAAQDVFVRCFKAGGVLDRAEQERPGGFRAYLRGVARNVAREHEIRIAHRTGDGAESKLDDLRDGDDSASRAFDRSWAREVMRQARELMLARAQAAGERARRRVQILQLRFEEGLPIREIARRWGVDAADVHHEYATARQEFRRALAQVAAFYVTGPPERIEQECEQLLALLV